jgi:integrase
MRTNGGTIEARSGALYLRIKLAGERRYLRLAASTREQAEERRAVLAGMLRDLDGQPAPLAWSFLEKAAGADAGELRDVLRLVAGLRSGKVRATSSTGPAEPTIKSVAEAWISGELARRYPDHIRAKRTADGDRGLFAKHVFPLVGEVPIKAFSLEHAEAVLSALPDGLRPMTRRNVAAALHRLLAMAVFPLRLRTDHPLPRGFLPRPGSSKAKAFLYPAEDARLLACSAVPLASRLFYGFLAREGMRAGEALALAWSDLDLTRGVVALDRNKTDEPRAWALSPGVAPALAAWRERQRDHGVNVADAARVFVAEDGSPYPENNGAPRFRAHLLAAGVDRAELHARTAARIPIRLHDTRATMITLALANGRSEAWVTDRTGHKSSAMVARYKRTARMAAELDLGLLAPLDTAIPELAAKGPGGPFVPPGVPLASDSTDPPDARNPHDSEALAVEVRTGFEPAYNGFANRCLTTWLPHQVPKERCFLPDPVGPVNRASVRPPCDRHRGQPATSRSSRSRTSRPRGRRRGPRRAPPRRRTRRGRG